MTGGFYMFDLIPFDRRERNMMRMFDDMEKNFFDGFTTSCKTDIADKGEHYLLEAEMPGFDKENIHIDIDGNYLTIHAQQDVREKKEHKFIRQERSYNAISRSFNISDVDTEQIKAKYKNGVLELTMPKLHTSETEKIKKINIE